MSQYSLPVIGLSGILLAAQAGALELGGIRVLSDKDEPFKADIELSDVGSLRPIDIAVSLASEAEFKQVRLDRPGFLNDLQYDIILNGRDGGVIHVYGPVAVPDEEWDLLLETRWPNGRELKQFVVDTEKRYFTDTDQNFGVEQANAADAEVPPEIPPVDEVESLEDVIAEKPAAVVNPQPAMAASAGEDVVPEPEPVEMDTDSVAIAKEPEVTETSDQSASSDEQWNAEDTYTTVRGDVLWRIARRVRPADDVSIYQTLLALQQLNEDAFVRNNVNRLKVGQVLRIPNESQVRANDRSTARLEIGDQIREWEAETGYARQIDARTDADNSFTPSVSDTPSLSLSTDSGDGVNTAIDADERVAELTRQLEDALAQLQKAQQMNATLSDEVTEKNRLVADLQNKLKLLSAEMAELQSRLGDTAEDMTSVESSTDAIETPDWSADAEDPDSEFENVAEEAVEPVKAEPKPQTEAPKTWRDHLLSWSGGAALLALLSVLGLFWMARRRKNAEEIRAFEEEFDLPEERQQGYVAPVAAENDTDEDYSELDQRIPEDEPEEELVDEEDDTSDPLKEADIYLAYGRFPEAADMLEQALIEEPEREDYLEKLILVHAAAGNEQAEQHATERLADLRGSDLFEDELLELEEADDEDIRIAAAELDDLELDLDDGSSFEDLSELEDELDLGDDVAFDDDSTLVDGSSLTERSATSLADGNEQQAGSITSLENDHQDFDLDEVQPVTTSGDDGFPTIGDLDDDEALQQLEDLDESDDEVLLDLQDEPASVVSVSEEHEVSLHSARQLIEHGDHANARNVLEQLVSNGTALEKQQARELLLQID
ncbi:MAG: FimV/HubP family polar landmark protein [Pseudomonadota bacterium]